MIQRAAESLRRSERAERLDGALAAMAGELADARRQIALLKRENEGLRARLEAHSDRDRVADVSSRYAVESHSAEGGDRW